MVLSSLGANPSEVGTDDMVPPVVIIKIFFKDTHPRLFWYFLLIIDELTWYFK